MPLMLEEKKPETVVLLGDGFFARGFLRYINHSKYSVTQIYRDKFINPQDIIHSLQNGDICTGAYKAFHLRDLFTRGPERQIQLDIKNLTVKPGVCTINNKPYYFDHLVVGLGADTPLTAWKDNITGVACDEGLGTVKPSLNIIGMGPTGMELASIISKKRHVHMYDMMPLSKVMNYVSLPMKQRLLSNPNITFHFEETVQNGILCIGSRPHSLTRDWKISDRLELIGHRSVYVGGDCINSSFFKTGQVAYQQGVYTAKKLNGDIPADQPFIYQSEGIGLNIGDNRVIIEGHPYVPDGVYPSLIIKLYSIFFV
jgi:NADH dehydrogenase FAD-containing subunit